MAIFIPDSLTTSNTAEQDTFAQLRRHLSDEWTVWHASALEVAEDETVPFLLLSEDAGIVTAFALDATLTADSGALHGAMAPLRERLRAFQEVLIGSEAPGLIDGHGALVPALHPVYVATGLTAKQINSSGLRGQFNGVLLGKDEIGQLPDIVRTATTPDRRLTPDAFTAIRSAISPSIEIVMPSSRRPQPGSSANQPRQERFVLDLNQEQAVKSFIDIPDDQQGMVRDLDARLIRGVAGSGKSLVLLHRAHYLAQKNPNWKVLVVTYNRALADFLRARYSEMPNNAQGVTIRHFHAWCYDEMHRAGIWKDVARDGDRQGLFTNVLKGHMPSLSTEDIKYLLEEFDWMRDIGIDTLDAYLEAERRGRQKRFDSAKRREVWRHYQAYYQALRNYNKRDWPQVATDLHAAIQTGQVPREQFHAILVDEAQDFAPTWFRILQTQLKRSTNALFLVADVAQKIYRRQVSWRALGIDLTSRRIRVLKRSYRNTYQILKAANDIVADSSVVNDLKGEGEELTPPELSELTMRRGALPVLCHLRNVQSQVDFIAQEIDTLRTQGGYAWGDFAVFVRNNVWDSDPLVQGLRSRGIPLQVTKGQDIDMAADQVKLVTLHSSKGLEFSVVFIVDVDKVQPRGGLDPDEHEKALAEERRLLYVGMTRARDRLYLMHATPLPMWLATALVSVERLTA